MTPDGGGDGIPAGVRLAQRLTRIVPAPLRRRMRKAMFAWLDLSWTTPAGAPIHIRTYDDWVVLNEVWVSGDYDDALAAAIAGTDPRRPLRVLDIGANVGMFTARVFDYVQRRQPERAVHVTAVEANPRVAERTRQLCQAMTSSSRTCSVLQGLAGRRTGSAALHQSVSHVCGSTFARPGTTTPITVPYVDLTAVFAGGVDLLKCDIEGSEQELVETYLPELSAVGVAIFEFHGDVIDVDHCRQLLRASGLEERLIRDRPTFPVYCYLRPG